MSGIKKFAQIGICLSLLIVLVLSSTCASPDIPNDATKVDSWFSQTIIAANYRKSTLDPNLATAEAKPVIIKVRKDGSGQFKTVQQAVNTVKTSNTVRTIIDIGPGEYVEKIKVERFKPYITFLGDAKSKPILTFNGDAAKYGTWDSASVIVESDYFVASNIIFRNTSPKPDGKRNNQQAVALRISGDKATLYNCRLLGFQDTLCDDLGKHFFKDCYIEGTVDFVFGDGHSIYLNCELHVINDTSTFITAQARMNEKDPGAFSIVHGKITGTGGTTFLGRSWRPAAKVVYSYTTMSDVVTPPGWSDHNDPPTQKTVFFGEYQCKGPGANLSKRVSFMKKLTDAEAKPFLTLNFIEGMKWLLPPPKA